VADAGCLPGPIPARRQGRFAVIRIEIANETTPGPANEDRWRAAVEDVLKRHGVARADVSLAVVDDATIHELNRRFLDHDFSTDVLSFVLESSAGYLEGEIVASAETATRQARRLGWTAGDELLLYIIHGALHLVGFDDTTPKASAAMWAQQRACLARFGLDLQDDRSENESAEDDLIQGGSFSP